MKIVRFCVVLLLVAAPGFGEESWKKELLSDAVQLTAEKMAIEEHGILKARAEDGTETMLQVKVRGEAPAKGVISRDNFVLYTALLFLGVFGEMGGEFDSLEEPIGETDLDLNIYMTAQGFQVEVKDKVNNKTNRVTQKWSEFFAE